MAKLSAMKHSATTSQAADGGASGRGVKAELSVGVAGDSKVSTRVDLQDPVKATQMRCHKIWIDNKYFVYKLLATIGDLACLSFYLQIPPKGE